jgi:hypothetical protein
MFFSCRQGHHEPGETEGEHGGKGGPPLLRALWRTLHDHPDGVGHARGGLPAPREERAQASAVDAVFFEVLSKEGPWLRCRRRVEGCHRPQDNAQVGLALY